MKTIVLITLFILVSHSVDACEMTMGYRTNARPPHIEKSPSHQGLYYDIFSSALASIGCKLKVVRAPKKRIMKMLYQGEVDFYPGLGEVPERKPYVTFFPNTLNITSVIVTRENHPDITDLSQLDDKIMLRSHGVYNQRTHDHKYARMVLDLSLDQAIKALLENKADFFQYGRDTVLHYFKHNDVKGLKVHLGLFETTRFMLGFSKKSLYAAKVDDKPSKMIEFKNALIALENSAQHKKIMAKYYH